MISDAIVPDRSCNLSAGLPQFLKTVCPRPQPCWRDHSLLRHPYVYSQDTKRASKGLQMLLDPVRLEPPGEQGHQFLVGGAQPAHGHRQHFLQ